MKELAQGQLDVTQIRMEMAQVFEFYVSHPRQGISLDNKVFRFNHKLLMALGEGEKTNKIGVKGDFTIELVDESEKVLNVCKAEIAFAFHIPNLHTYIHSNKLLDETLSFTLLTLSYSTARGMVAAQTKGTVFERAFLPILPPKALLPTEDEANKD